MCVSIYYFFCAIFVIKKLIRFIYIYIYNQTINHITLDPTYMREVLSLSAIGYLKTFFGRCFENMCPGINCVCVLVSNTKHVQNVYRYSFYVIQGRVYTFARLDCGSFCTIT